MTVTTEHFLNGTGSATTFPYTFPYYKTSDIKVKVGGALKTEGTHYNVTGTNIVFKTSPTDYTPPSGTGNVHIYRETDVDTSKATFAAGSSIRATDLNNNELQLLYHAQEQNFNAVQTADIKDGAITSAKILDGTIATADIATGAINADKIAADAVGASEIAADAVGASELANNAVDTNAIQDDAVTSAKIGTSQVGPDNLANLAVTTAKLNNTSVTADKLASNSVITAKIDTGAVTTAKIATDAVTTAKILDNNIVTAKIANDSITADKMADNSVDSQHYIDGSIDTVHIGDAQVNADKLATNAVTNAKVADNAINSENYVDGSIDAAHIASNAVTTAKIADDAVTVDKIAINAVGADQIANNSITTSELADDAVDTNAIQDGNVTEVKLASNAVTQTKIANNAVTVDKIANNAVQTVKIADNSVTADKIADAVIVTNSEQAAHSVNDTTFFTTSAAEARYFNASTGETIKDGQTFPDNDTTIATTAAINDRIIDLVDDVGGFVPIANETSFPNANPDVNNGTGTIVSVSTLASNHTSNGSGVISISNGTVGNSTVTINGAANSTTYSAGYGLLVETTSTLNTYTFHRLVPKATEVTTVAGKATEIGRLGTADAVADMNLLGTTAIVEDMNLLGTTACVADMALLGDSGVISDMATIADTSNLISNIGTVAGVQANVTNVGNSITNVNSVASNLSNVNNFADLYQIASSNPSTDGGGNSLAEGDLYFNTSANELKVYNGGTWQGGVTASGNFASTTGNTFTGNNIYNDDVKVILGTHSDAEIYHNNTDLFIDNDKGNIKIRANVASDVGGDIHLMPHDDEYGLKVIHSGGVEAYYGNAKKFETTSSGSRFYGDLVGHDSEKIKLGSSADLQIYHDGSNSRILDSGTGNLRLEGTQVELWNDGVKVCNTFANGLQVSGISSTSTIDLVSDTGKLRLGASQDLQISHTGSISDIVQTTGTEFQIRHSSTNGIQLRTENAYPILIRTGGEESARFEANGAVKLYYDNAKKFETTSVGWTAGTLSTDSTGSYMQLSDSSSYGFIIQSTASKPVTIRTDGPSIDLTQKTSGEYYIRCLKDAAVELYHNNVKTFETTGNGIKVSGPEGGDGELIIQADEGDDNADKWQLEAHTSGAFNLKSYAGGSWENNLKTTGNGNVELYYDNSRKFETTSYGNHFNGNLRCDDASYIQCGTSQDLLIGHDGSNSYISNSGGALYLRTGTGVNVQNAGGTETYLYTEENGAVFLRYDNSTKLETTSAGATVSGQLTVDGNLISYSANNNSLGLTGHRWNDLFIANDIDVSDNGKLLLGDSDDIQIFHDGYNKICGDNFYINNKANSEVMIYAVANGQIQLYYDNSKKLETTSTGITVSGASGAIKALGSGEVSMMIGSSNAGGAALYFDGDSNGDFSGGDYSWIRHTTGGDMEICADNPSGDGHVILKVANGNESALVANANAATELYYDGVRKFRTTAEGAMVDGSFYITDNSHIIYNDTNRAKFGNGADLQIYHSGSHSYIDDSGTGDLMVKTSAFNLRAPNEESLMYAEANGTAQLYYDSALKFATSSSGAHVYGSSGNVLEVASTAASGAYMRFSLGNSGNQLGYIGSVNQLLSAGGAADLAIRAEANLRISTGGSTTRVTIDSSGHLFPQTNGSQDLGASGARWRNIYTSDLQMSNEGSANEVDGTWGNYTIQEGEDDLFLINRRNGKKYKFNLTEVS